MVWKFSWLLTLAGTLLLGPAKAMDAQDLVLLNATVIDGTGAAPRDGLTLVVRDGSIAEITTETRAGGEVIDLNGRFVLPGLLKGR